MSKLRSVCKTKKYKQRLLPIPMYMFFSICSFYQIYFTFFRKKTKSSKICDLQMKVIYPLSIYTIMTILTYISCLTYLNWTLLKI